MYHDLLDDDLLDTADRETASPSQAAASTMRSRGNGDASRDGYRLCYASRSLQWFPSECLPLAAQVTDLDLSGNLLSAFTRELEPFRRLSQLDLSANQLTKLGDSLAHLTHLRILLCKNNLLEASGLPKSMATMRSLEIVNLSGNRLAEIPDALLELPNLKQLYLGGNQITDISPSIRRVQS